MAGYSARISTMADGDVITAALFNNEFTGILNSFHATTGHKHDGTAGEGGIITALRSNPLTFGAVDTSDVVIKFEGGSGNDGFLTWDQSADKFIFADAVKVTGNLEVTGTADFGESNFTNVGSIALDSITGDDDPNTSITFSGSDVITMATGGTTRFAVNSSGVDVTGIITADGISVGDDQSIYVGAGNDLQIIHNTSDGSQRTDILETGSGNLRIAGKAIELNNDSGTNEYQIVLDGTGATNATKLFAGQPSNSSDYKLSTTSTGVDVNGTLTTDVVAGGSDTDTALTFAGSNQMVFKAGNVNQMTVGQGTGTSPTLQIAPAVETGTGDVGLGAIGLEMKNADLRMRVDNNYSSGTSLQNNSRLIFDIEGEEHIQDSTKGYKNPALIIQANSTQSGNLSANISQLGSGDLNISAGILKLKSKTDDIDTGAVVAGGSDDPVAGDGYFTHSSFTGLTLSPDGTVGTKTRLHYGQNYNHDTNVRLEPTVSGIYVESMGDATTTATSFQNTGTIGVANDIDLLTLANQKLTITGDASAGGIGDSDHALVVSGAVTIKGTNDGGQLIIENSGSSGSDNPDIVLFNNNSGNGADGDKLGGVHFYGKDDAGNTTNYGVIAAEVVTAADGSTEASKIVIRPRTANSTATDILTIGGTEVKVPDDIKMAFGDNSDLVISHKSANGNSVIAESGSGNLILQADDLTLEDTNSNKFIKGVEGGTVQIWHNAAAHTTAKLATTATGIDVNGIVSADGLTIDGDSVINGEVDIQNGHKLSFFQGDNATDGLQIFVDTNGNSHIAEANTTEGKHLYITGDRILIQKSSSSTDKRINIGDNNGVKIYGDDKLRIATGNGTLNGANLANNIHFYTGDGDAADHRTMLISATGIDVTGKITASASGIADNDVAVYGSGVADDDFLRINGTDVEGRSASEVLSDIGAQASLTFGISNTNAVKVDSSSVADDEYARFTANGLESRSTAEVLSDIGAQVKNTLVDRAGANVVEDEATSIGHDIVKTFVGKTFVYTGTADIILGLPAVGTDIAIGDQIHLVNASTTDGAELQVDLDECGTNQPIRICTGSSVVTESTGNPHIQDGGSVTLIAIGTNEYAMFGSGIENN